MSGDMMMMMIVMPVLIVANADKNNQCVWILLIAF
jgi:hypothetical protein